MVARALVCPNNKVGISLTISRLEIKLKKFIIKERIKSLSFTSFLPMQISRKTNAKKAIADGWYIANEQDSKINDISNLGIKRNFDINIS